MLMRKVVLGVRTKKEILFLVQFNGLQFYVKISQILFEIVLVPCFYTKFNIMDLTKDGGTI